MPHTLLPHNAQVQQLKRNKLAAAVMLTAIYTTPYSVAEEAPVYEEIVVTGQKIHRSLQDTPSSVAVANELLIEQNNITSFSDFMAETANSHSTADGGFSIRGIDGFNVSGGGNSYLATVYVDGAALPQRMVYRGFSSWDVKQIEVLRGPQSTLQGRNSLAGSVIMTTQAPTQEWQGKYRVQAGQNGEREIAVAAGGGLIEDQLAFRLSAEKTQTDGFNTNITRNEAADHREDELYRLKVLWEPDALNGFSAQLGLTYATSIRGVLSSNTPGVNNPSDKRITTNNDPQDIEDTIKLYSLELNQNLNPNWDAVSVSSYSEVISGWQNYDDDNGPEADGTRDYQADIETFSQELRFVFDYEKLSGVIGAYYYDQNFSDDISGKTSISLASAGLTPAFLQAQFGLDAATANFAVNQYAAFDPAELNQLVTTTVGVKSYAAFADARYQISSQWDVFAGLRWDHETQENADDSSRSVANEEDMPDPANYAGSPIAPLIAGINGFLQAQVDQSNSSAPLVDANFSTVLPKIGISYHWSDNLSSSFIVQQGYRSGGVGTNSARGSSFQYDPEYTTNYELSWRSLWLDGALTINANAFFIDWTDQQVDVQLSSSSYDRETVNAGKSTVKGFEVDSQYQITDQIKLYASIGQAVTEFKDFNVVIPTQGESIVYDLAGRSFSGAPEWTTNVGMTYTGHNGIFANLSINYAADSAADVNPYARGLVEGDYGFDLRNDKRTLVNFQLGYEWQNLGVYLMGKNIFDEEYIISPEFINKRTSRYTLGEARQLSLSVRGTF